MGIECGKKGDYIVRTDEASIGMSTEHSIVNPSASPNDGTAMLTWLDTWFERYAAPPEGSSGGVF